VHAFRRWKASASGHVFAPSIRRGCSSARERGVELPEPLFGQQLMTDQERERLRERLEDAENEQDGSVFVPSIAKRCRSARAYIRYR
jgi:hypothetical protein